MAWGKTKAQAAPKTIDWTLGAKALAKAVADGDYVNFRLLFQPFSPLRPDSTEQLEAEKYAYLRPTPDEESQSAFQQALALVQTQSTWGHVQKELDALRPAQLPSELLLTLGDNAIRQGKYTAASQAYELMRIRRRMQQEFLDEADSALDAGDIPRGVRGYRIGAGLSYNYAAFPEPLPLVADYQTRALMLHGEYPRTLEDCVALQPVERFAGIALGFLLVDPDAASRLESRPVETQVQFLVELVDQTDPGWQELVDRYRDACAKMRDFEQRIETAVAQRSGPRASIQDEVAEMLGEDPRVIPATLLGREIPEGEWWQYLKELAVKHPAATLFVSRQVVGQAEIIVPRFRGDSSLPAQLRLAQKP